MIKRIRPAAGELFTGSALRHLLPRLAAPELRYDTERPARCNDVLLGEVAAAPPVRFMPSLFLGREGVRQGPNGLEFFADELREGLVAIAAGDRYAPRDLLGGVRHPVTGAANPPIRGGSVVSDLNSMVIAGHVNALAVPHERCGIRVLGLLVDDAGAPVRLARQVVAAEPDGGAAPPVGVLVAGSSMEVGKTTICMALAAAARAQGLRWTYEKKTGTGCVRDLARVATGDYDVLGEPGRSVRVDVACAHARDFVDATGAISDVSMEPEDFVTRSLAFSRAWQSQAGAQLRIVELADNLSHRTNLTLLQAPAFRRSIQHLVYVPSPSYDAMDHAWHFVREGLGWRDVTVHLGGALATDPRGCCLREEIACRLGIASLAVPADGRSADAERFLERMVSRERVRA